VYCCGAVACPNAFGLLIHNWCEKFRTSGCVAAGRLDIAGAEHVSSRWTRKGSGTAPTLVSVLAFARRRSVFDVIAQMNREMIKASPGNECTETPQANRKADGKAEAWVALDRQPLNSSVSACEGGHGGRIRVPVDAADVPSERSFMSSGRFDHIGASTFRHPSAAGAGQACCLSH